MVVAGIAAFVTGAGLCLLLPFLPDLPYRPILILILLLLIKCWSRRSLSVVLLLLAGLCWAAFRADLILSDYLPERLEGQDLWVTGRVMNIPERRDHHLRFEFEVDTLSLEGHEYDSPGKVRLVWYRDFPALQAGGEYRLLVRLKRPHGLMNPGGFDYEGWLFSHGIRATGYVREGHSLPSADFFLSSWFLQKRQKMAEGLLAQQPGATQNWGLIMALALGERQWIRPAQWQVLNRTGTSHLIAISGLHIGLIASMGFFLGRWLWSLLGLLNPRLLLCVSAPKVGAWFGIFLAVIYAALAGFAIPAQRALIMVVLVMLKLHMGRQVSLFNILLLALLMVVIVDPLSLISAGFWLSFAAVALISYGLFGRQERSGLWLRLGYIHFLLALGLMPFLLLFFAQQPLLSPIANLLAVPLVSLLVVPLVLAGGLMLFFSELGVIALTMALQLLDWLWELLDYLQALPLTVWQQALPDPIWLLPTLIGVLLLLIPAGMPGRWVGVTWLLPLMFYQVPGPPQGQFNFTLLDVGQGLAAVVRTREHSLVFDTGARFSQQFEMGSVVIGPFLKQQGIASIDTLIISHADNDHIGGAEGLLRQIPAVEILSSVPQALPDYPVDRCRDGRQWQWDGVDFLLMQADSAGATDENNLSCVLKVTSPAGSLLLTGDIEAPAEQALAGQYGERLAAEILVAPHHGSKTSSSEVFLQSVNPRLVLYPVGYRNRYGFPHPQVHQRYLSRGITPLSTSDSGSISILAGGDGLKTEIYRREHQRLWHRAF